MSTRSSAVLVPVSAAARTALRSDLSVPLCASTAGALLLAMAPALPIAHAADGSQPAPAFTAGPLLALLAVGPIALAWVFAVRGHAGAAAGVLAAVGALAPARGLVDLQLVVQPWWAARPELLVPTSLAPLRPGLGSWVLLLGQVMTTAGGVLALLQLRRPSTVNDSRAGTARAPAAPDPGMLTTALCLGAVTAAGLVAAPFASGDPYLLPQPAVDAPPLVMAGTLLLAGGVVLVGWLAAGAPDSSVAAGALLGTASVVVAAALPPVAAAVLSPALSLSWGPLMALAGAAGLGWLSRAAGRGTAGGVARREEPLRFPALDRLHAVAGGLALVAGASGLVGAAASQVLTPDRVPAPMIYPARLLVPAAVLLLVPGAVLLTGRFAGAPARPAVALARPALAVCWAAMALAVASVLDAALAATQITGVRPGPGAWAAGVALLAAVAAGAVAGVAGTVERDEVDLSQRHADRPQLWIGGLGAALAVPAFGLPLLAAPGYGPPGLWSNFGVASWGLLTALAVVVCAALLAPWSRPAPAAGLLAGALGVLLVHLSQVPLTGRRAGADTSVAAGTWFGAACVLALLAGCGWVWRRARKDHRARPSPRREQYPAARAKRRPAGRRRP